MLVGKDECKSLCLDSCGMDTWSTHDKPRSSSERVRRSDPSDRVTLLSRLKPIVPRRVCFPWPWGGGGKALDSALARKKSRIGAAPSANESIFQVLQVLQVVPSTLSTSSTPYFFYSLIQNFQHRMMCRGKRELARNTVNTVPNVNAATTWSSRRYFVLRTQLTILALRISTASISSLSRSPFPALLLFNREFGWDRRAPFGTFGRQRPKRRHHILTGC